MDTTPEDFLGAVPSNPALIELDEALVLLTSSSAGCMDVPKPRSN
jgi:hypothetical protein